MLSPSIVYHKAVHAVLEKVTVHGITHVTGGGIPSKLRRVLKESGLGASLDSLFDPHEALQDIVKLGSVPLEEAYKTWNMGNGMLIIIDPKDEDVVMNTLTAEGVTAQQVGRVTTESQISLQTYTGETVVFE